MLKDSGLLNILEKVAYSPVENVLSIYGDPAYPVRPHLTVPNRVGEVEMFTPYMPAFNEAMSSARVSVEWLFGDVLNSFKFLEQPQVRTKCSWQILYSGCTLPEYSYVPLW